LAEGTLFISPQVYSQVDFDKWVDEDDAEAEMGASDFDINQMLANMGGGAGMGDMDFGAGGMPGGDDDSDDEGFLFDFFK